MGGADGQHEHGIQKPRDQAQLRLVGRVEAGEVVSFATLVHGVGRVSLRVDHDDDDAMNHEGACGLSVGR